MTIYMVQKIDGYDGWGRVYYGDVIEVFKTREDAERYCYDNDLTSAIHCDWPSIVITEKQVK